MEAALSVFTAAGSMSRPQTVGMYLQRANSKLCFPLPETISVTENSLPARGMKTPPKSALLDRRLRHERIAIFSDRRGESLTLKISIMEKNRPPRKGRGGRPAKTDTASHCVMVRFNDTEHARFLTMYEQSGLLSKAAFIKARVFEDVFRVIKTDRGTLEYVAKLTQLHAQFRAVGTNYNQIVKLLHTHFSERKALAMLYKLENATKELAAVGQQIIALSEEFQKQW